MKRAKKKAAPKPSKKAEPKTPPEASHRPFEVLGKKKAAPKSPPPAKAQATKPRDLKAKPSSAKSIPPRAKATTKQANAETEDDRSDAETFALYMAGVRALGDKATRIPRSASRVERAEKTGAPPPDLDAPARAQLRAFVVEGIRFETSDDGERIEGRRIEVEPREVRRLRRGEYTVDQQLDLHGMNASDSRKALETFIEKRKKEGDRVVRIIHGKGSHSPRGVSVLRGEIAAWLSQGPAKRHVAAFATAPREEGGAGAVLVLLMRGHP